MSRFSGRFAVLAAVLVIALATLIPLGQAPTRVSAQLEWSDVLVNLTLFLPLGVALALRGASLGRTALLALLLSGGIELLQATLIPGRRGTWVDLFTNAAGALAGALLVRGYLALRRARSPARIPLAAAALALPVGAWLGCAWLLAPEPPPLSGPWWGQWAHHFEDTEPFRGSILSLTFLGRPAPDGPLDSTPALRAEARKGALRLELTLSSGGTATGLTHLASIADGNNNALIGLEQNGDDLLLRWRSRAARFGLRRPQFSFPGALRSGAGERLAIAARVTPRRASVSVTRGAELRTAARRLTVVSGWRSLIPTRGLAPGVQTLFDLVWTLGLVGYVLAAARVLRSLRLSY
jgi:VanZ family protein